jgi:hypothetical protein
LKWMRPFASFSLRSGFVERKVRDDPRNDTKRSEAKTRNHPKKPELFVIK